MRIVYDLDVLKPHEPGNDVIARSLKSIDGVKYVAIKIDEIDNVTTSVFITIQGTGDLELEDIKEKLEELNCALHSLDKVYIYDDDWLYDKGP